jgi:hypothetical protein
MQAYVIYYKYKGKQFTCVTKPCTRAQAIESFHSGLNSLGSFELVRVVAQMGQKESPVQHIVA